MVFTASDGTEFEDRDAWRQYEFETNYTFKGKKEETLMKLPGQIQGQPFDLADLDNCQVLLLDHCDQVQVDNLVNCRVFIGPSSNSVFIRNCTNCVFTVACKQLRTRDCSQCHIFLYSLTDPIIETSNQMIFAPFNGAYHGLRQHFTNAGLEPENNHWAQVYDFNDPDKTGENWRTVVEGIEPWTVPLEQIVPDAESFGHCENPVPLNAQPVAVLAEDSSFQTFSINTSQGEAEAAINATTEPAPTESLDSFVPEESGNTQFYDEVPSPQSNYVAEDTSAAYEPSPSNFESEPYQPPPAPVESFPSEPAPVAPLTSAVSSMPEPQQNWPMLDEFEQKQAAEIEEKRIKEEELIRAVRAKAEEDLDKYYGDRTDKLAHRAATNREHEDEKKKMQATLEAMAVEQPWNRVTDLVDTNLTVKPKSTEEKKKDDVDLFDTSRMRSLLVQLKNTGGPEVLPKA
ncbi:hypothetical protein THRCLA_05318 [Thraustotheca clavata]|uniref:Clathrin light chain n=1 Tax=Thraustotheca clavata TaxID=74557 RepID=A0A1V9ZWA1_9STRA|nr:hypothetical protein THRCLA_05318 [Thraustotheca clavata]